MSEIHYTVEPFNEFALGSCFDEAYLPAVAALHGDKTCFILNQFYYFRHVQEHLCISSYSIKKRKQIEKEFSIESEMLTECLPDPVSYIIRCLEQQKLVICRMVNAVAFDPLTNRKTQKSFSPHWILVYGFDRAKEVFDVLEHKTIVSAQYAPFKMHFHELKRAFMEGCAYDEPTEMYMTALSNRNSFSKKIEYYERYRERYFANHEKIISSENSLKKHMKDLHTLDPDYLNTYQEITLLSEIIRYYHRETWLLKQAGIYISCIGELQKALCLLRTYCIKYINLPSESTHTGLVKYSSAVDALSSIWFEELYKSLLKTAAGSIGLSKRE